MGKLKSNVVFFCIYAVIVAKTLLDAFVLDQTKCFDIDVNANG